MSALKTTKAAPMAGSDMPLEIGAAKTPGRHSVKLSMKQPLVSVALASVSVCAAAFLFAGSVAAQEWPSKPVRIVVPFLPGSAGDIWGRLMAPRLEALWKQPVLIENKPGASGLIGTEMVVNSPPDGHTLLQASQTIAMAKLTAKNIKFDPQIDLVPVYKFINYKMVFATNGQTKAKANTLSEFVALSKATPTGLFFGGTGPSSVFNVANAMVTKNLGIKLTSVDYPGPAQITVALLRNDVQFVVNTPSAFKSYIETGAVHPLAVISDERYPDMPDVPTLREAGYSGFLPQVWAGFFAPRNTPPAVVEKIGRDFLKLATTPEFKDFIESRVTGSLLRSSPTAFRQEIQTEFAVWKDLFASIKFTPQ